MRGNKTGITTIRSKSLSSSISRAMISSPAPHSFKHVAHVGVNKDGIFEASKDLDGSWKAMLAELQSHGVSEAIVVRNSDFVEGFWKDVEAIRTVDGSEAERIGGETGSCIIRRPLTLMIDGAGTDVSRKMTSASVM